MTGAELWCNGVAHIHRHAHNETETETTTRAGVYQENDTVMQICLFVVAAIVVVQELVFIGKLPHLVSLVVHFLPLSFLALVVLGCQKVCADVAILYLDP